MGFARPQAGFQAKPSRHITKVLVLDILRDIWQGTKQPKEEPIARATQELQKSSTRSLQSAKWLERDGLLYYRSCIYVLDTSNLRRRIVLLCHDTMVAGHPGRFKTLELVS